MGKSPTVKKPSSHEYAVSVAVCDPPPREILGAPGNSLGSAASPAAGEECEPWRRGPYESGADGNREKAEGLAGSPGVTRPVPHRPALDLDAGS